MMGWIRKILWLCGGLILMITALTMVSQVFWQGLGWDNINLPSYLFWYIFGGSLILSMFIHDIVSYYLLRTNVQRIMDESERITPEEIAKQLDEPLWRVRPIFRKKEEPGVLISQSGKYIYFTEAFGQKIIDQYAKGLTIGEIARDLALSKVDINLILDELDYKGVLPEVVTPSDRPQHEETQKVIRKTVRLRKRIKKKRHK
jgi:uncharacterized membrane protein